MTEFINNKFKILNAKLISKYEKEILNKIYINKASDFHISDYHKWINELINDCYRNKFLKFGLFKIKNTKKFSNEIKLQCDQYFNKNIINFIDSDDVSFLIPIFKNIKKIKLSNYVAKVPVKRSIYPFNKDNQDVLDEAVGNRYGSYRHWKLK